MRRKKHIGALGVLGLFLLASQVPRAQSAQVNPLAGVKSLACTFPVSVVTTWENGEPQPVVKKAAVLTFRIDQIDTQEASARFIGPASSSHLTAQLAGSNLYFIDIRPAGSLMITTVFAQESRGGKLKAVHSRTDYLRYSVPGFVSQPEVSQHAGECEPAR